MGGVAKVQCKFYMYIWNKKLAEYGRKRSKKSRVKDSDGYFKGSQFILILGKTV